jgi:DNA repair ATPase RecN
MWQEKLAEKPAEDEMSDGHGNFEVHGVTGQGIAIGHGARATFRASADPAELAQVTQKLAELSALIEKHADRLDDPATAREALAQVNQELRTMDPQPSRLKMLLSAITGAASGISAIATAVAGVRGLLGL